MPANGQEFFAIARIPKLNGLVRAGGCETPTVWTDGHAPNFIGMRRENFGRL